MNTVENLTLSEVKNEIEKGSISVDDASSLLKSHDIQNFIHRVLDNFNNGDYILTDVELVVVSDIVHIAYYIYTYSGIDTGITDTEYDKLYELITVNGNTDFISLPLVDNSMEIATHAYPQLRGSLSKIHYLEEPKEKENKSRKTLDKWIDSNEKTYFQKTGKTKDFRSLDIYVFPKWDGVSVVSEFDKYGNLEKALTRGYTRLNIGEDVTHHFKGMKCPLEQMESIGETSIPYGLKTEVMVLDKSVEEYSSIYKKDYKQSRSIASSIINSKVSDEKDDYLVIVKLRYITESDEIEKLHPSVFDHPFIRCKLGDYDTIEEFAQNHRVADGLRCDGAVIYIIDPEVQKILGRDNDKNNFEVAYKFTEEYAYSKVKDIVFQVGLLGRVTPVVKIKPIKLKGNTISSVSLNTMERFKLLNLAKGDKVKILYDIIPYITIDDECEFNRSGEKPIKLKERCPSCNSNLEESGAFLLCTNMDCDCRKKGKILNYITKLRIQDISYATIDHLYENGFVTSIKDLYKLRKYKNDVCKIDGFGEVMFNNWINQIDSKRRLPDYFVLGALGIDGIAEKNFFKILSEYSFDEFMDIVDTNSIDDLIVVEGIGHRKAKKIISGIKDNKSLIKFLWKELDIYHKDTSQTKFEVCFTKIRDIELEKYIISLGGEIVDRINKGTNILVVPTLLTTSSKVTFAKKHEIEIVEIDKLKSVLDRRYGY